MNYAAGSVSDIGIRRKTNQDSFYCALAQYRGENLAFLVICDGMGGYANGEVASASVVNAMEDWFRRRLPRLLQEGFSREKLQSQWEALIQEENSRIGKYARRNRLTMGTTLTAALFLGEQYYIVHVGDCRLYEISQAGVRQLTHDHTVTQREVDLGNLTPEEAQYDSRQHILLQCLGAGRGAEGDFVTGPIRNDASYLLCSDGFRHIYSPQEMARELNAQGNPDRETIERSLFQAVERIKARGETDNITAGLLVVR